MIFILPVSFCTACQKNASKEIVFFPCASRSIAAKDGAVFTSSDNSVVTVDDSGLALAVSPGKATITVQNGSKKSVYNVTVLDPNDYIKLYDSQKITLKHSDIMEKLDAKRKELLLENATWSEIKTATQTDDRVTINYEGKMNGKAFKDGSANNYQLILGSGNFIAGFEDGLVGYKTGDEIILDLKFPENYTQSPELSGKPVTFTVKIIKTERPELPIFDNEFVQQHTNYENTNEFDEKEYLNAKITLAISQVIDNSEIFADPPKALYDHYYDQYLMRMQTILYYQYGVEVNSLEETLELLEMTEKELRDSAENQLTASVVQDCVFHAFAYKNSYHMTEDEFAKGTAVYITENGYTDLDDLLNASGLSLSDVRELVFVDYLGEKIADMVTIVME